MKTKYLLFSSFLLLFCFTLQAQTKIIAHKSHSGKPATFNIHSTHNFGLTPIITTDTVIHVSDSVFVAIMSEEFSKSSWRDTVKYSAKNKRYYLRHIFLGKSLDELKEEMPNTVFIGFEEGQQHQGQNQNFHQQQIEYLQPKKNSTDNMWWILLALFIFFGLSFSYIKWKSHQTPLLLAKS